MQKKLIALALASLAGTAFAQSNVTVYGVVDGSFDNVKASGSTAPGGAGDYSSFNRVSGNSSYIGFKGAEDLGNGLKAVFQLEAGLDFTQNGNAGLGGTGSTLFNSTRDSFVGVAGGFGTVVLGNLTGPTRALGTGLDVNAGATGIGANNGLIGKIGGATLNGASCGKSGTCNSIFDTRWANAIAYVSPSFSGLNVVAAYVANENRTSDATNAAQTQLNTSGYDVGVNYNNGPIMAGIAYNAANVGNQSELKVKNLRVGGSYNFGVASIRVLWERTKAEDDGSGLGLPAFVLGGDAKQSKWGIGGTYNVTPAGKVLAQYYRAADVKGSVGGADSGAKLWELGYQHDLSKRTSLKATYAQISNDDNANFDFGVNAAGIAGGVNTLGNGVGNGAKVSGFQVGVRHSF